LDNDGEVLRFNRHYRRKKCDEIYPICGHCKRLNLICRREEPRALAIVSTKTDDIPEAQHGCGDQSSSPKRECMELMTIPRSPDPTDLLMMANIHGGIDRRFFMKYYTQVLANLVSTNHENNSFLTGKSNQ
jgi:hypothetical protein